MLFSHFSLPIPVHVLSSCYFDASLSPYLRMFYHHVLLTLLSPHTCACFIVWQQDEPVFTTAGDRAVLIQRALLLTSAIENSTCTLSTFKKRKNNLRVMTKIDPKKTSQFLYNDIYHIYISLFKILLKIESYRHKFLRVKGL